MTADHATRSWVDRAACRDLDPELFFPIGASDRSLPQIEAASAVCARCPVADDCLSWALNTGQDYGVWGGTTPEERRAMRRTLSRSRSSRRG